MRIALIGNHPDGVALAEVFQARGDCVVVGLVDVNAAGRFPAATTHADIEDLLARSDVDLVIVAGPFRRRGPQLRRAMQSRMHVLCVSPAADSPDTAYEAALIQGDTKKLLLPIVPQLLDSAVAAVEDWLSRERGAADPSGRHRLFLWEQVGRPSGDDPAAPDWFLIRRLGGDIVELTGMAPEDNPDGTEPIIFSGRFQDGSLLHGWIEPNATEFSWSLTIRSGARTARIEAKPGADLEFSASDSGGPPLKRQSGDRVGTWRAFAEAVYTRVKEPQPWLVAWQDEIRVCEWDDALRRSIVKRKVSTVDYQEISEEVGSRGTLTLIGCGMVWLMLLLAFVAIWQPLVLWGVIPLLLVFFALLLLNWLARKP
ncbi:MAG: hypothetical protein N2039_13845 [Gemmataceae bacterium]|nr:hypothetical protein [Gemmataceae bacterium]